MGNPWRVSVITLMPEMYPGPLGCSLIGDALARNLWQLSLINLRNYGIGVHQKVDDTPAGGGAGMVLKPDVVDAAIMQAYETMHLSYDAHDKAPPPLGGRMGGGLPHALATPDSIVSASAPHLISPRGVEGHSAQLIHFSPRGERMSQPLLRELSQTDLILLCGRYEAVDERVLEKHQPLEISLGDFVLTGGDIPAMALIDGCVRLLPGVVGRHASLGEESFGNGAYANLLEYPHYTKPTEWEGRAIPEVLLSGHHGNVEKWRLEQARAITAARRPDLLKREQS